PSTQQFRESFVNGNFATPLWDGQFSSTGQIGWFRFHGDNDFIKRDRDSIVDIIYNDYSEEQPSFEIGANYDRSFGEWDAAFVGLVTRRYYRVHDTFDVIGPGGNVQAIEHIRTDRDSGESILRGSLMRPLGDTHSIEFGAEGAINALDNI